jgi:hypothetical protein
MTYAAAEKLEMIRLVDQRASWDPADGSVAVLR